MSLAAWLIHGVGSDIAQRGVDEVSWVRDVVGYVPTARSDG